MNNGGKFNETLRLMYAHPIATVFILDTTLCGITNIVRAIRGGEYKDNMVAKELKYLGGKLKERNVNRTE